jgi:hypothetical protein
VGAAHVAVEEGEAGALAGAQEELEPAAPPLRRASIFRDKGTKRFGPAAGGHRPVALRAAYSCPGQPICLAVTARDHRNRNLPFARRSCPEPC